MTTWRLVKRDTGALVVAALELADGFWSRARGLQFRAPLPAGAGLLLVPCPSVHTCFVRGALDIVLLDRGGRVLAVRQAVKPWRIVAPVRGTYAVLELPAHGANVAPGDVLRLEPAGAAVPRSVAFLIGDEASAKG